LKIVQLQSWSASEIEVEEEGGKGENEIIKRGRILSSQVILSPMLHCNSRHLRAPFAVVLLWLAGMHEMPRHFRKWQGQMRRTLQMEQTCQVRGFLASDFELDSVFCVWCPTKPSHINH